jgi:hypothetical protein
MQSKKKQKHHTVRKKNLLYHGFCACAARAAVHTNNELSNFDIIKIIDLQKCKKNNKTYYDSKQVVEI